MLKEIVIDQKRADEEYWRDIWRYRELLLFFSWRDVLVRYKQTAAGIAWAVVRPAISVFVMTLIFSRMAQLDSGGIPYPVLVVAAALPWQFFASALGDASASLIGNANLITKVYFPRVIVPISAILTSVFDFGISLALAIVIFLFYKVHIGWQLALLPLLLAWAFAVVLGPSLLLSALSVKYRDFRYVVPFLLQVGTYISPVGFATDVATDRLGISRVLFSINPMVGVIDAFRWVLIGGESPLYWPGIAMSLLVSAALVVLGTKTFRDMEKSFADVI